MLNIPALQSAAMKRYFRQFLLVLLTLLQCMVPVAHAHAGGANDDRAVHVHDMDVHMQAADQRHIERAADTIVSAPDAHVARDLTPSDPPSTILEPTCEHSAARSLLFLPSVAVAAPLYDWHHPPAWPQAPPRTAFPV